MGILQYLAMTDGEIAACARLPQGLHEWAAIFPMTGLWDFRRHFRAARCW